MKIPFQAFSKALSVVAVAGIGLLSSSSVSAQALVHRYSFNGSASDSIGGANGSVIGNVTFSTMPTVNGAAVFAGGTSKTNPGYISLPAATVNTLQNATLEMFTTNFTIPNDNYGATSGFYQALFSVASPLGNTTNYLILSPNRAGPCLGIGERINNAAEQTIVAHDPLPASYGNHIVDLVFSGFSGIGSTGTETIYVDGTQVAQAQTVYSFAKIASGSGGAPVVGIGGGSPFNDPTFQGSMSEVRIYDGALTQAQLQAEITAGPAAFGYVPGLHLAAPAVSPVTTNTATVDWTSSNAASTTVNYGMTAAYGATTSGAATAFTHSVNLAGLAPGTTYHYQVVSQDIYGQTQTSADSTFTTVAPPLTLSTPAALAMTSTTAVIGWTSSNTADATVSYGTSASYGSTATGTAGVTAHSVTLAGLAPFTLYHYQVTSKDAYGQTQSSPDATFVTASASGPRLSIGKATIQKVNDQDVVTVTVGNTGGTAASGVNITTARLGAITSAMPLPVSVGAVPAMGTATASVAFPAQASGTSVLLQIVAASPSGNVSGAIRLKMP